MRTELCYYGGVAEMIVILRGLSGSGLELYAESFKYPIARNEQDFYDLVSGGHRNIVVCRPNIYLHELAFFVHLSQILFLGPIRIDVINCPLQQAINNSPLPGEEVLRQYTNFESEIPWDFVKTNGVFTREEQAE
jgi:hypothetical protein